MNEPKWPPGPWRIEKYGIEWDVIAPTIETCGEMTILTTISTPGANGKAIAQLAAASPRLYTALETLLAGCEETLEKERFAAYVEAREALAEARGEMRGKAA